MTQFNWIRAVEGALVTAIIAGAASYQAVATNPSLTAQAVTSTVIVTFAVAFVKGIGQSLAPPAQVSTTITQPAGTSAITETIASGPAPLPEVPHG
jgi:hypothetical protein